jgi:hypothetical protein
MKIDPLETNYVSVKYYSGDAGRTFNIYVDDQLLKAETVRSQNPTGFYDVLYEIPAEWVEGKSKVTIKFANRGSSYVGGVFDRISILKGYNSNTELESIIVDGVEAQLANDTYFVGEHVTEVGVNISPVDKNALVYVDGILIDDTVPRIVTINSELISMNVKVVAEDGKTTKDYVINLSCSISH